MAQQNSHECLSGWGGVLSSTAEVVRANSAEDIQRTVRAAGRNGNTIIARGAGFSYGDPSLNASGTVLNTQGMNRVLNWDGNTGVMDVEPGCTVRDICEVAAADGWWPPVVPGTKSPTIGGCLAANAHGKNNWKAGPLGEHVDEVEMVLASGDRVTLKKGADDALLKAVIGGVGLFGVFVRVRLQMARAGRIIHVERYAGPRLEDVLAIMDRWSKAAASMVGWVDAFPTGDHLGRGLVQVATEIDLNFPSKPKGKPRLGSTLTSVRKHSWMLMKPVANQRGMRAINAAQYTRGSLMTGETAFAPRDAFEFFHDAIPNWNKAFSGGIIQYQMFIPDSRALDVFSQTLEATQAVQTAFLAVIKRHRADTFLFSPNLDGYSLSLDFQVTKGAIQPLKDVLERMTEECVLPAGGRFYLAKDVLLNGSQLRRAFGEARVEEFLRVKRQLDPDDRFQSDLSRRVLRA